MIMRLEMKNWNMIFTEKQQKHQYHHLKKTDKYECLTGEEDNFTYSALGKALEKQITI